MFCNLINTMEKGVRMCFATLLTQWRKVLECVLTLLTQWRKVLEIFGIRVVVFCG